jgi:hypothetical protein
MQYEGIKNKNLFKHKCSLCGDIKWLGKKYPFLEFEEILGGE